MPNHVVGVLLKPILSRVVIIMKASVRPLHADEIITTGSCRCDEARARHILSGCGEFGRVAQKDHQDGEQKVFREQGSHRCRFSIKARSYQSDCDEGQSLQSRFRFADRQIWNGDDSFGQLHVQVVNAEFQSNDLELTHLVGLHRINNLAVARDVELQS